MGQKQKKSKVFSEIFRAIFQILFAVLVALGFGVLAFAQFVVAVGGSNISPATWLLSGTCLAGLLLFSGIRNLNLASRFYKVIKELNKNKGGILPLEKLSTAIHCPVERLNRDIQVMMGRDYFSPPIQLDLHREELVAGNAIILPPISDVDSPYEYKEVARRSPAYLIPPVICAALLVLLLNMAQTLNILITVAAVVISALYCRSRAIPIRRLVQVKRPKQKQQPVKTGDRDADQVLTEARNSLEVLRRLSRDLSHTDMGDSLKTMASAGGDILSHLEQHPDKLRQARQFLNYYLPTTLKLMQTYIEFSAQSVKGDNILRSMEKIERMAGDIATAFRTELDNLYFDRAVDISADVDVMQSMLRQEGIGQGEVLNVDFSQGNQST